MNSKSKKKTPVKKTEAEKSTPNLTESELLAKRKAQAIELAAKKDADFSLDEELHDIKNTLLDSDEPSGLINEKGEVVKLPEEDTLPTPIVPPAPKKRTTKKKATPETPVAATPEAATPEVPVEESTLPFAKTSTTPATDDSEGKVLINNLQKLRDQINAQKALERELIKKEATKVQDKDKKIMSKLNQLEQLVKQNELPLEDTTQLEDTNAKLLKQLSNANKKIQELQSEFNRLQEEQTKLSQSSLEDALRQNEEKYNAKIVELERLVTEQKAETEERIRQELEKQKGLEAEITALKNGEVSPKELEAMKKALDKNFALEVAKSQKEFAQKEKAFQKELDALTKKHEKTLLQEKDKSEKKLLKKQEEFFAKLDKQKTDYEKRLLEQKEKSKEALKEEKARLESIYKASGNEQVVQLTNDYEARLVAKDEQLDKIEADYEAKIFDLEETLVQEKAALETAKNEALAQQSEEYQAAYEALKAKMQKELDDARYLNEIQKQNLLDSESKFAEQTAHFTQLLAEERSKMSDSKVSDVSSQEMKAYKEDAEAKMQALREQVSEANHSMDAYKRELEKTKEQLEQASVISKEEKAKFAEQERKLIHELEDRNREIKTLKADIERIVKENETKKLESQLTQITNMVNELGKTKESPQPYGQYNFEYEKELERRKRITAAMMREEEEQENRKQEELKASFNQKIEGLESQVRELGSMLKVKVEDNSEQNKIIKSITDDFETFKKELKQDLEKQREQKENENALPLRKLVEEYTRDKDLLLFQHKNEINNYEVDKKFVNDVEILKAIDDKIRQASIRYSEMAQHRDLQFQRDLAILNGYQAPVAPLQYVEPKEEIPVGEAPEVVVPVEKPIVEEPVIQEPLIEEPIIPEPPMSEPVPPVEEVPPLRHSTIVYSRGTDKETFVGTIDQEYLRRLNSVKQMKLLVETRKKEIASSYETELAEMKESEKRLVQKIDEVNRKIDQLRQSYDNKAKNTRNQQEFETENTKLNVELQSRKEQLRKLREEDMVKMNHRYQNSMTNLDNQYQGLLEEEKMLKDEYVLKQQKTQSKVEREEQLVRKLNEEQLEGRVIESQEEIKRRNLEKVAPIEEPVSQEVPVKEEVAPAPVKETQPLSPKEQELRNIFAKYVEAQKRLLQDFVSVREYQEALKEKRAYLAQNEKFDEQIKELMRQLQGVLSSSEKSRLEWQIKDVTIRKDNNKTKVSYRDRQLTTLALNKHVQDYIKIIERLDAMNAILKQYAAKRGQDI